MATPAQKHFKKEMNKLNRDGLNFEQESIYSPVNRKKKSNRPWWTYSLAGIILFAIMFSTIPIKIYNDLIVNEHDKIFKYLGAHREYTEKSDALLNQHLTVTPFPSAIDLASLQQDKTSLNVLLLEAEKLKVPAAFKSHKQSFLEAMEKRLFIITYLEVIKKTNSPYNGELTQHINELNVKRQLERNRLMGIFETEDIDYTIEADGTIIYHIKTYYPNNPKFNK